MGLLKNIFFAEREKATYLVRANRWCRKLFKQGNNLIKNRSKARGHCTTKTMEGRLSQVHTVSLSLARRYASADCLWKLRKRRNYAEPLKRWKREPDYPSSSYRSFKLPALIVIDLHKCIWYIVLRHRMQLKFHLRRRHITSFGNRIS